MSSQEKPSSENSAMVNDPTEMEVGQNTTNVTAGNVNTTMKRKRNRRHRKRSEKQKERTRKYMEKKRDEQTKIQSVNQINESNNDGHDISRNLSSALGIRSPENVYYYNLGMCYPPTVHFPVGETIPVTGKWCDRNVSNTTRVWQQALSTSNSMPRNNAVSLETEVPSVSAQSEIVSTLRSSADIFIPRNSSPERRQVSNLRASAEPFVPATKSESVSPACASADIPVPSKSTFHTELKELNSSARCSIRPNELRETGSSIVTVADMKVLSEPSSYLVSSLDKGTTETNSTVPMSGEPDTSMESLTETSVTEPGYPLHVSSEAATSLVPSVNRTPTDSESSLCIPGEPATSMVSLTDSTALEQESPSRIIAEATLSLVPLTDIIAPEPGCPLQISAENLATEISSDAPPLIDLQNGPASLSLNGPHDSADNAENMVGILAIYAESSLHCEIDETLAKRREITGDDFGYVFFSVSNL